MKFILDTNIYIHYNLFTECKWSDLFGTEDLTLMVTPTIIKELDEKKYDQRDHIRKRAQEIISIFRNISNGGKQLCGLAVEFPSLNEKIDWDSNGLNPMNADDRIIAESLILNKISNDDNICIVTADFGLEIKAQNHNLRVMPPLDAWKRKQKDPRDKEIEKLREFIKTAVPELELCFYNESDRTSEDTFRASMGKYDFKLVDDECINKVYEEIKEDVRKELLDRNYGFFLPNDCIKSYENRLINYPEECLKYFKDLNKIETKKSLMIETPFVLCNSGNLPAEDLDIWMTFPGDLEVSGEIPESPKKPKRPNRPKSLDDCFPMNLAAINFKSNPLINLKEITGPEIESSALIKVHYHLKKLKHGLRYGLPLFIIFDSKQKIHNFQIEYAINIGNHPKQINGKLFVIVSEK